MSVYGYKKLTLKPASTTCNMLVGAFCGKARKFENAAQQLLPKFVKIHIRKTQKSYNYHRKRSPKPLEKLRILW